MSGNQKLVPPSSMPTLSSQVRHRHNSANKRFLFHTAVALKLHTRCASILIRYNTDKPAHDVTSIKQSPVLKGHNFFDFI